MNTRTRCSLVVCGLSLMLWACAPAAPPCVKDADCAGTQHCVSGGCQAADSGTPPANGSCTNGDTRACGPEPVGACRKGTQTCVNGVFGATCSGQVTPTSETCNGIDDDCDGLVDEEVGQTWYVDLDGDGYGSASRTAATATACAKPTGYAASNDDCDDSLATGAAIHPGASEICDAAQLDENCNGTKNESCGCAPIGSTQSCCSGRGIQTCQAGASGGLYSACSVVAATEVCNGVDDDCDGEIDEAGPGLCATEGQTCSQGSCGCASGQMQCGSSCLTLGAACTVGQGACARSGVTTCAAGASQCSATAGSPSSEVCNKVDDNCDGVVDEAGPGLCPATGQTCNAGTCSCPEGQQVCGAVCRALTAEVCDGIDNDCDGQIDEGVTISCLVDSDGDRYARTSKPVQVCADESRAKWGFCPVGTIGEAYSRGDDCDDKAAAVYQLVSSRNDADGDLACAGAASNDCVGSTPLPGRQFAATCGSSNDCDDTNPSISVLGAVRADVDGDAYCVGAIETRCMGNAPLPGYRIVPECRPTDDCDDSSRDRYQNAIVRPDADGDGYCAPVSGTQCIGAAPPTGYKYPASCAGDDCSDTNSQANTACVLWGGYTTTSANKACVFVPPTETFVVSTTNICPLGFYLYTNSVRAVKTSGNGSCQAINASSMTMSCNGLDGATCHIEGDCYAL